MENLTPIFIAITGAAVLLQAGLLAAMYLAMRKTSTKLESIAEEMKNKSLPTIDNAQLLLTELYPLVQELRPKIQVLSEKIGVISDNVSDISTTVRSQVHRAEATVNDIIDRTRLQVIRTDEMVTRTLDRVESASEAVHKTVVSPVRQVQGVIQGISAGVDFFLHQKNRGNNGNHESRQAVPQDEMFI